MTKLKLWILFIMISLTSCATRVTMDRKFFENPTKVGIIMEVDSANVAKMGGQGLLDMAISSGRKYKAPLKSIAQNIDPKEATRSAIEKDLNLKHKNFEFIDYRYNPKDFQSFDAPSSSKDEEYFKKDLRPLKSKLNVDELMLVKVNHGVMVSYSGFIEIGKQGYNATNVSVVDLNDNKILFQDQILSVEDLKGKWNVQPYEILEKVINKANAKSLETLNSKLDTPK